MRWLKLVMRTMLVALAPQAGARDKQGDSLKRFATCLVIEFPSATIDWVEAEGPSLMFS